MSVDQRIRKGLHLTNAQLPQPETRQALDHVTRDARARTRRRRHVAVAVAAALVLAGTAVATTTVVLGSRPDSAPAPLSTPPSTPLSTPPSTSPSASPSPSQSTPPSATLFVGSWMSEDIDGSSQTMTIRETSNRTYEMVLRDNFTGPCSGPSTDTGTGEVRGGRLLITGIKTACENGHETDSAGTSIDYVHDREADVIRDNVGVVWSRVGAGNAG